MNNRSSGSLLFSKALIGFVQAKQAEGLSLRTVYTYRRDLEQWVARQGDLPVNEITSTHVRAYLAYLRTDYVPRRLNNKNDKPLSAKTIRNVWATFSAFFTWAKHEFGVPDPMDDIPAPKYQKATVLPLTQEQVEALIKVCERSSEAQTTDRHKYTFRRATAVRDRAIIKVLLDTGLRATELCQLKVGDYDTQTGDIRVRLGKGGKSRMVYVQKNARRDLWRYLSSREDGEDPDAPLFLGRTDKPMNKDGLRHLLLRLGERAGVKNCHPHRMRHTFAIEFLRGGGDVFSLQKLLGHSSLDMVRHYLHIAQVDVRNAHRRASPVDKWRL